MRTMILAALLLAGCATGDTAQRASDEIVPRYQGKPVALVIDRWGAPQTTVKVGEPAGAIYGWSGNDCRLEAHTSDSGKLIGIRTRYDYSDAGCAAWIKRLR